MTRTKKWLIALIFLISGIYLFWGFVNRSTNDYYRSSPKELFLSYDLMNKMETDTVALNQLIDAFIGITGSVKNIQMDAVSATIEIGDSTSMSSIICQMDTRHLIDLKDIKIGDNISIKGKMNAWQIDQEFGLGNSIQMNFCTLFKK